MKPDEVLVRGAVGIKNLAGKPRGYFSENVKNDKISLKSNF